MKKSPWCYSKFPGFLVRVNGPIPRSQQGEVWLPEKFSWNAIDFFLKERKRRVRKNRTEKVTKRPAGIRTGDFSLTGRMLFRLSHKSRSVVNGVRIRLNQSIVWPSLTSHLLPYTLHARFGNFFLVLKERKRRVRNYRTEKVTKRPAGIRTGDLLLTGECSSDWATSHKSRSVVNGVRIRLSQSILSPSLTSHLLPYTLHARFGNFFFFELSDKDEKLVRDVSPSQGLLQSAKSQTEEAPERAKCLSPISRLCLIFYKFFPFFFERKKEKSKKLPKGKSDQETKKGKFLVGTQRFKDGTVGNSTCDWSGVWKGVHHTKLDRQIWQVAFQPFKWNANTTAWTRCGRSNALYHLSTTEGSPQNNNEENWKLIGHHVCVLHRTSVYIPVLAVPIDMTCHACPHPCTLLSSDSCS